jgi:plastocyanin
MILILAGLTIVLAPLSAGAVTHTINQSGLSFSPSVLTIEAGDTVEWVWSGGSHTVTSGTDLSDPEVGILFDESLNSGNQTVSHTFTTIGNQDFFCRPHLNSGMTGTVIVTAASPVEQVPTAAGIQLRPNVPNPFNPTTRISFDLSESGVGPTHVSLRVFDLKGRLVRVLVEEKVNNPQHSVVWNGRDLRGDILPSGVYVVRLEARGQTLARTMTLAK